MEREFLDLRQLSEILEHSFRMLSLIELNWQRIHLNIAKKLLCATMADIGISVRMVVFNNGIGNARKEEKK